LEIGSPNNIRGISDHCGDPPILAAQISEKMSGRGLIPIIDATSMVNVDMKSITVMLSTKAERNAAMKGKRMKSLNGSSFTHRAL
jgi:hypothetical protein